MYITCVVFEVEVFKDLTLKPFVNYKLLEEHNVLYFHAH